VPEKLKFPKTNSPSGCLSDAGLRHAASKQCAEKRITGRMLEVTIPEEGLKVNY
jgi:hypothetical protein